MLRSIAARGNPAVYKYSCSLVLYKELWRVWSCLYTTIRFIRYKGMVWWLRKVISNGRQRKDRAMSQLGSEKVHFATVRLLWTHEVSGLIPVCSTFSNYHRFESSQVLFVKLDSQKLYRHLLRGSLCHSNPKVQSQPLPPPPIPQAVTHKFYMNIALATPVPYFAMLIKFILI